MNRREEWTLGSPRNAGTAQRIGFRAENRLDERFGVNASIETPLALRIEAKRPDASR
jgi:hypothetical protein